MTQAERITALEVQQSALTDEVRELKETNKQINIKLGALLDLKNKGAGAFWLMSIIFGTAITGWIAILINYVKWR